MKHLLIVMHTPSPNTRAMRDALIRGTRAAGCDDVTIRCAQPLETQAEDVLWANAVILGTTENFGYMSGALKDFFDRIYYPCLEKTPGMPFALLIRAGLDGTGTQRAVEAITTGLKWRAVQPPVLCKGEWDDAFLPMCEELGQTMTAALDAGVI